MKFFNFLLATTAGDDAHLDGPYFNGTNLKNTQFEGLTEIVKFLNQFIMPITIVLCIMAALFAIVLAFYMIKSDDPSNQAKYKKRMFGIVSTIVIVLALLWLLGWLFASLPTIMNSIADGLSIPTTTSSAGT